MHLISSLVWIILERWRWILVNLPSLVKLLHLFLKEMYLLLKKFKHRLHRLKRKEFQLLQQKWVLNHNKNQIL